MPKPTSQPDIVKKVFDTIISLEPGSKIPLQFSTPAQRESFRVRFYAEKLRYQEKFGEILANTITCTKQSYGNTFFLIIEKTEPMSAPYIVLPDGSTQAIVLTETSCEPEVPIPTIP